MSIWALVRQAYADGKDPVIKVSYSQMYMPDYLTKKGNVRKPKPPKGTKRVKVKTRFTFRNVSPRLGGSDSRPRCLNQNCRLRLRADQAYVCNDVCRTEAIVQFKTVLHLLEKRPYKVAKKVADVPDVPVYDIHRRIPNPQGRRAERKGSKQKNTNQRSRSTFYRKIQQATG